MNSYVRLSNLIRVALSFAHNFNFLFSTVIEVSCGEYGDNVKKLVDAIQNGKYDIQNNKPFPNQEQLNNFDAKSQNGISLRFCFLFLMFRDRL